MIEVSSTYFSAQRQTSASTDPSTFKYYTLTPPELTVKSFHWLKFHLHFSSFQILHFSRQLNSFQYTSVLWRELFLVPTVTVNFSVYTKHLNCFHRVDTAAETGWWNWFPWRYKSVCFSPGRISQQSSSGVAGQRSVPWSCDTQNLLQGHLEGKNHQLLVTVKHQVQHIFTVNKSRHTANVVRLNLITVVKDSSVESFKNSSSFSIKRPLIPSKNPQTPQDIS